MKRPIKLKFKHHPSPPTDGCTVLFGICILIPIGLTDRATKKEYEEGFGIAQSEVIKNQFHLIFERRAALDSGMIPIQMDWNLGREVANAFGFEEIIIRKGEYRVDFSKYEEFGECFFDTSFT